VVPLILAAYIESRAPGITPLRAPVPIVQVHHQSAQSVAERLARTLDLQPAFAAQLREPIDGTGTVTRSVVPYTEAPVDTEPLGWARFACALFSQMT
jgi:hypothetical protein